MANRDRRINRSRCRDRRRRFRPMVYLAKGTASRSCRLAGEAQSFIEVMDWRKARELILMGHKFAIADHAFSVFEANVGKIGFLPPDLARKVTEFYSYAGGIVQDFQTLHNWDPSK